MSHPILKRLGTLARAVRWLLWVRAWAWVVAIGVSVAIVLAALDYWWRVRDPGLRWLMALAWWGAVGGTVWRLVWPLRKLQVDPLRVAQHLQRLHPQLEDRLASAVEFLQLPADDVRLGSAQLRRELIHQVAAEFECLPTAGVIRWRKLAATGAVALAPLMLLAGLWWWQPGTVAVAAVRLLAPWSPVAWPQRHKLKIVDPVRRIARGEPWRVIVVDEKGSLPDQVWLHLRLPSGQVQRLRMRRQGEKAVFYKPAVRQGVWYRATGGDDQRMPWRKLQVVDPPQVVEAAFQVFPPSYTGWKPYTISGTIRALAGSTIAIQGRANMPLERAVLVLESPKQEVELTLGTDKREFFLPPEQRKLAQLKSTTSATVKLLSTEGVWAQHRPPWKLEVVADAPPRIALLAPQAELFLTPRAVVEIRAQVQDDLGVHRVWLRFLLSTKSAQGHQQQTLYQGPSKPAPLVGTELPTQPKKQEVSYRWDLAPLALSPGAHLTWQLVAEDHKPQQTTTGPLRITIISPEELHELLAGHQQRVLAQLQQAIQMQREAQAQLQDAQAYAEEAGHLTATQLDQLKSSELAQRQVSQMLLGPRNSLQELIEQYLRTLQTNRLDHPEARERMQALGKLVQQLDREHLRAIGRDLASSVKQVQTSLEKRSQSAQPQVPTEEVPREQMHRAIKHQQAVLDALERQLVELTQWDNYRRFYRELGHLRRRFEELAQQTRELAQSTLGKSSSELSASQRAQLNRLAQKQEQLARQLHTLTQRMARMAQQLQAQGQPTAEVLREAIQTAQQRNLEQQIRQGAQHTRENRMGQAMAQQQRVLNDLEQMLDVLSDRREQKLLRLQRKLRQVEKELEQLHQEQLRLAKRMRQLASQNPQDKQTLEQLRRLQRRLAQEAQRLTEQLRRLRAQRAAQGMQQAAQAMQQAAEASSGQQSAQSAEQARRALQDVQRQLEQRLRQLKRQLAFEQLARLDQVLQGLLGRQRALAQRTAELDQQRRGKLTVAQQSLALQLADDQQLLAQELREHNKRLKRVVVFFEALQGAADQMETAAALLARGQPGPPAQEAQGQALQRLQQVLEALKQSRSANASSAGDASSEPDQEPSSQRRPGLVAPVAQLRLLKLWQQALNARTEELSRRLEAQKDWAPELQHQLDLLRREQGRLADLLLDLATGPDDAPEEQLPQKLTAPLESLQESKP